MHADEMRKPQDGTGTLKEVYEKIKATGKRSGELVLDRELTIEERRELTNNGYSVHVLYDGPSKTWTSTIYW